jgi:glutaredoxin
MNLLMITKNDCPYCTKLKEYLRSKGINFSELNIENYPAIRTLVKTSRLFERATVPQLFDGERLIGDSAVSIAYFEEKFNGAKH